MLAAARVMEWLSIVELVQNQSLNMVEKIALEMQCKQQAVTQLRMINAQVSINLKQLYSIKR